MISAMRGALLAVALIVPAAAVLAQQGSSPAPVPQPPQQTAAEDAVGRRWNALQLSNEDLAKALATVLEEGRTARARILDLEKQIEGWKVYAKPLWEAP